MNLPNKLTVLRVILIVPFVVCMLVPSLGETGMYAAVAIFIIASLTDLLDGKIARKYNLVTNFGKFMDPLADKLLVAAALICLTANGTLAAWISIIIISREFIISGFRLVASDNGIVIAASYWGKFKTTFQMVMIVMLILNFDNVIYQICALIVTYAALILTVISLIDYVVKNKAVLREQK
ncbi:CDP-diacylglycerol--glycerol-3-phosphate 3-phosphatidyltransferase [Lachnospiraceae bacterium 66-29]